MADRWRAGLAAISVCIAVLVVGSRVEYGHYRDRVTGTCPNLVLCVPFPYHLWLQFKCEGRYVPE